MAVSRVTDSIELSRGPTDTFLGPVKRGSGRAKERWGREAVSTAPIKTQEQQRNAGLCSQENKNPSSKGVKS
jgi:hypothetical protein